MTNFIMAKRNNVRYYRLFFLIFTHYISLTVKHRPSTNEIFSNIPPLEFVGYTWVKDIPNFSYEFVFCYVNGTGFVSAASSDNSNLYEIFMKFERLNVYTVSYIFKQLESEDFKNNYDIVNDDNILESLKKFDSTKGVDVSAIKKNYKDIENTDNMLYTNESPTLYKEEVINKVYNHEFWFNNTICKPRNGISYFSLGLSKDQTTEKVEYSKYRGYINTDSKKKQSENSFNFTFYDTGIYELSRIKVYLKDLIKSKNSLMGRVVILLFSVIGIVVIGGGFHYYIRKRKYKKKKKGKRNNNKTINK